MTQIDVGGELLDLYPDSNVVLNIQANSLGDIGSRNSSYSQSLTIPRTANNVRILEQTGEIGNQSTFPYTTHRVRYTDGNVTLIKNGVIVVLETLPTSYRVVMYDGVIDLSTTLGNQTLRDLSWSGELHYLSQLEIEDSFSNTEGFIYALADFGYDFRNGGSVESQRLMPSFYAHSVWDKIFTQNGLTYSGDFFSTDTDWTTLLLMAGEGVDAISGGTLSETSIGSGSSDTNTENTSYGAYMSVYNDHAITSDTFGADLTVNGSGNIVANYDGILKLTFTSTFTNNDADTNLYLEVLRNGTWIASSILSYATSPKTHTVTFFAQTGDVISYRNWATTVVDYSTYPPTSNYTINYSHSFSVAATKITGGAEMDPSVIVPEMTQAEFVKDIMQRYGLLVQKRTDTEYQFVQIDALLADKSNAVEWTDKVYQITSEGYDSGYAQSNYGAYKYPSSVDATHDGTLTVSNENAPLSRTVFSSPFEIPSEAGFTFNSQTIYEVTVWNPKDTGEIENKKTAPKLMRLQFDNTDITLLYAGGSGYNVTDPVPYASLVDMNYQYFIDNYLSEFNTLLNSYKEISVMLNLNDTDLNQLDLLSLVYLQQTGQYYYIESIRTGSGLAEAKLIQLP